MVIVDQPEMKSMEWDKQHPSELLGAHQRFSRLGVVSPTEPLATQMGTPPSSETDCNQALQAAVFQMCRSAATNSLVLMYAVYH